MLLLVLLVISIGHITILKISLIVSYIVMCLNYKNSVNNVVKNTYIGPAFSNDLLGLLTKFSLS